MNRANRLAKDRFYPAGGIFIVIAGVIYAICGFIVLVSKIVYQALRQWTIYFLFYWPGEEMLALESHAAYPKNDVIVRTAENERKQRKGVASRHGLRKTIVVIVVLAVVITVTLAVAFVKAESYFRSLQESLSW